MQQQKMASFRNAHKSLSVEERAEMKEKFEEVSGTRGSYLLQESVGCLLKEEHNL